MTNMIMATIGYTESISTQEIIATTKYNVDLCHNIHTSVRQPNAQKISKVLKITPSQLGRRT